VARESEAEGATIICGAQKNARAQHNATESALHNNSKKKKKEKRVNAN
jgi:hypothetical protein